jgi:hypothetical protein
MTAMVGNCYAAVHDCNDADELGELVHVVGSVPHRKQVVGQVIDVVPAPVVGIEECLRMPLRAPDRVRMIERRRR